MLKKKDKERITICICCENDKQRNDETGVYIEKCKTSLFEPDNLF